MAIIVKSGVPGRRMNIITRYLIRNLWASCAFVVTQVKICRVSRGVVRDLVFGSFIVYWTIVAHFPSCCSGSMFFSPVYKQEIYFSFVAYMKQRVPFPVAALSKA
jgi:hypothetical protein